MTPKQIWREHGAYVSMRAFARAVCAGRLWSGMNALKIDALASWAGRKRLVSEAYIHMQDRNGEGR